MKPAKTKTPESKKSLTVNKKAFHDYTIVERLEAGLVLEGWEVKSLREGRVQLKESHVIIKNEAPWLLGMHVTPLKTASTHIHADPVRTRKLLLKARQIAKLIGQVDQKGYTLVPLELYWKKNRLKLDIGLAKGKKLHDKRAAEKDRDWQREKERLFKTG